MATINVFDQENRLVSTFKRSYTSNGYIWTHMFSNSTTTYYETKIDNNNAHLYDFESKVLVLLQYEPCIMHMYIDAGKRAQMFPDCHLKYNSDEQDDNRKIMKLLEERLSLGKERYGHGVRIEDDTRQWGTSIDSWETMMMEEALDGMIYAAASIIRIQNRRNQT